MSTVFSKVTTKKIAPKNIVKETRELKLHTREI